MIPFREVWTCDTEFQAPPGERPRVLCFAARELRSRREIRLWRDDLVKLASAPFDTGAEVLFVAFFASAELGCFLQLGWPLPDNVVDLYAEHRTQTNGLGVANSLLAVLGRRGLISMDAAEKTAKRELIMQQSAWSAAEIEEILHYCAADVAATEALLLNMVEAEEISWPHARWRGRYAAAVAGMEHVGVPIDVGLYNDLCEHWSGLKAALIEAVDKDFGVYDGTSFREASFLEYLVRRRVPWPCLPSGRLRLDRETFSDQARAYPVVAPLHELRKTLSMIRLTDLAVGRDQRNRALLSPFSTKTGRNAPSNSKFIFGAAKWLRALIKPPEGYGLAYLDWSAQEIAIAATLSGDERMMADYAAGDPHLGFAKAARLAPADATKESHGLIRERCKATNLGVLYGMREQGLSLRLGIPLGDAGELFRLHRGTYRRFWDWSDAMVTTALMRREIHTAFGWRMQVTAATTPRTLMNWPMQAAGAEMMRAAAIAAVEGGIEVAAPVHDAFLVVAPLDRLEEQASILAKFMLLSAKTVTYGFDVRVDTYLETDRFSPGGSCGLFDTVLELLGKIKASERLGISSPTRAPRLKVGITP